VVEIEGRRKRVALLGLVVALLVRALLAPAERRHAGLVE
jgi:hypothetical protein